MHLQTQNKSINTRLDNLNYLDTIDSALRNILPANTKFPSDIEKDNEQYNRDRARKLREENEPKFEYPKKTEYDRRRDFIDDIERPSTQIKMVPLNVATRGVEQFQQVGTISSIDASKSDDEKTTRRKILPLYGRRTYNGSSKWNYYTSTDGYHVVQLSIVNKNKDCMDEYGCDELYNDEEIYVQEYEESFRVSMYKRSPLKYIPYVS